MSENLVGQRVCMQGYYWYLLAYHYQSDSLQGLQSFSSSNKFFAVLVVGILTTRCLNLQFKSLNIAADPLIEHMLEFINFYITQTIL